MNFLIMLVIRKFWDNPLLFELYVGMLYRFFGQTGYRFWKTGFKSIIGFTDLKYCTV